MALHTEAAAARMRLVTFSNNICPRCTGHLFAPGWTAHGERRFVQQVWSCDVCGYQFETADFPPRN